MKQITFESVVNSTPKKLLLPVMYNYFQVKTRKKQLVPGFRNTNLENVTIAQLRKALIELSKEINLKAQKEFGDVQNLEEFEEEYNKGEDRCLAAILFGLAFNRNVDLCVEAYKKFFEKKETEEPKDVPNIHITPSTNDDELKKCQKKLGKYKETIDALRKDLDKSIAANENLRKIKKDKDRENDSLKEKATSLEAEKRKYEEQINGLNEENARLKVRVAELESNLQSALVDIENINKQNKMYIVVYGYKEACYECFASDDVIQPETTDELLKVGEKHKISAVYYRDYSLNRMQLANLRKIYGDILIESKDYKELVSMGYLHRKGAK